MPSSSKGWGEEEVCVWGGGGGEVGLSVAYQNQSVGGCLCCFCQNGVILKMAECSSVSGRTAGRLAHRPYLRIRI